MEPLVLTNSEEILKLLTQVTLKGQGFTTECLVAEVLDAGLYEPDFLNASGVDPEAYYNGEPNAWANYHIRMSKKVFMVYGGPNKVRTFHIADTP
ncbi:MAG: hypothetical protein MPW16_01770 [Candidatus Manganitrophus sp.]|uniref:Uncharacterized protein n=1 Tax=Candidatus Manganitrophus noduliformans TaxID=2606439 RepID=A0A7X6DS60_9BACT|nr:hypothetical protein [Candidatus Manganitrophus noduliformans]MCG3113747.1 hypothetical protein [Candidatus Manganitrophus morganii]NKE72359.1 hypothetical protein [Candidatus Manganitrophus noduliformans]WDT75972.1 MAG: hypothetical protein MPW16_01770 [Candidatus Manganitrophus sp.]